MKILVTGSTGFIGKHLIDYLLGFTEINIIATSSNEESLKKVFDKKKLTIIPFDIYDNQNTNLNLYTLFDKPDLLIHLAWNGLPNYNKSFHLLKNLPKEIEFITNLINHGLTDITITGTCFEYGMQEGCLNEMMECNPSNYYALAKDTLRRFLEIYCLENQVCFKWVRLFYMFGQGQNPNSLFAQLDRALEENQRSFNMSKGEQVRDYLPVEEVASNIVKIATQKKITGIINNCSSNPQILKNLVRDYLLNKNKKINLNLGFYPYSQLEPMSFWGDNFKLNQI